MNNLNIAVIGLGAMGMHHVRIYKELGVLSSVCDVRKEHAKDVGKLRDVKAFNNIDKLLSTKPFAISIAVPTPLHYEVTKKCLEAGCHVLLEKPITDCVEDGKRLVKLAEDKNLILSVGYIERYNPSFLALSSLVKEKTLGNIVSVNIKRVGGIPRSADNIILDLMTHDFNLLTTLLERQPKNIYTHTSKRDNIIDSSQVLLDFGETSATCEANWISPIKIRTIQVTGTKGYCTVDLIKQKITQYTSNTEYSEQFNKEPLKIELENFLEALNINNVSDIVTAEDALQTLKITLRAIGKEK